jgi:glycosylphosphatidylinositol transamidase (GPIT) subunit GPI8
MFSSKVVSIFFFNRHQSDVFHTYQVLKDRGFDDDHVIIMAVFAKFFCVNLFFIFLKK